MFNVFIVAIAVFAASPSAFGEGRTLAQVVKIQKCIKQAEIIADKASPPKPAYNPKKEKEGDAERLFDWSIKRDQIRDRTVQECLTDDDRRALARLDAFYLNERLELCGITRTMTKPDLVNAALLYDFLVDYKEAQKRPYAKARDGLLDLLARIPKRGAEHAAICATIRYEFGRNGVLFPGLVK